MSAAADVRTCEAVCAAAEVKLHSGSGASTGLSPIAIEDDMMLRTGDIIAADDGFKIAAISSGQKRSVLFRPLSKAEAQALGLSRLSSR
ncbi:hypothetical protein ACVW1C_004060 [Bradyrhizobium sp. USDA 4011]